MMVIGIDEVGRGCWAGPLVAGAVAFDTVLQSPNGSVILRDSKKMTKKQRAETEEWIRANAVTFGIGWVWPGEIDELGITASVRLAMMRAVTQLHVIYDDIIIDGNINYFPENPKSQAVVKADAIVPAVSAASIIAKVARDAYMAGLDERYAGYRFSDNVGYGTAAHIAALKLHGVSDIHRKSYKPIQAMLT